MSSPGYNFLWGVCALMLVIAIILAFKKGKKANRHTVEADNTTPEVVVVSHNEQRPRIHHPNSNNDPQLQPPPPSYQEYQKDVRIT
ncbi:hypothetical protein CU097_012279 [Rhizopus azygosporus]|uniref:Uncharacterized protein n=1 Tax=Rhizopus azygosporus TaxID=86630 RepID=A0A367JJ89_RHIAZ|nr:hypothetical protein CU097_012279 [Rhizopus azygosporus]